jgi:diacylglycerol kinase (ATP)
MTAPIVRVLLNPKAGSGAALRRIERVRAVLRRYEISFDIVQTLAPGDASKLVAQARDEGVQTVAVMGGDGTLNEASQAYIDAHGNAIPGPNLAVIPSGTGGDYKRSLELSGGVEEAIGRICLGTPTPIDLGVLKVIPFVGQEPVFKSFINITSFGVGGVADKIVNETPKWLGGKATFYLGTFRAMLAYENAPVRIFVDDKLFHEGPIFNAAIALGRYHGGGMKMAPLANLSDGLFDVISIGNLSKLDAIALSSAIYTGEHLGRPGVSFCRGSVVRAEPIHDWQSVLIDMDGETPGKLPLEAKVLPNAVRILL